MFFSSWILEVTARALLRSTFDLRPGLPTRATESSLPIDQETVLTESFYIGCHAVTAKVLGPSLTFPFPPSWTKLRQNRPQIGFASLRSTARRLRVCRWRRASSAWSAWATMQRPRWTWGASPADGNGRMEEEGGEVEPKFVRIGSERRTNPCPKRNLSAPSSCEDDHKPGPPWVAECFETFTHPGRSDGAESSGGSASGSQALAVLKTHLGLGRTRLLVWAVGWCRSQRQSTTG